MSSLVNYDSSSESNSGSESDEVPGDGTIGNPSTNEDYLGLNQETSELLTTKQDIAVEQSCSGQNNNYGELDLLINTYSMAQFEFGPQKTVPNSPSPIITKAKRQSDKWPLTHNTPKRLKPDNVEQKIPITNLDVEQKSSDTNLKEIGKQSLQMFVHTGIEPYLNKTLASRWPQKPISTLNSNCGSTTSLKWNISQFSHLLLSSSMDKQVLIWDVFKKLPVWSLKQSEAVKTAAWSMCGSKIIYGGYDKMAHVTDTETGINLANYSHQNFVTKVEIHPTESQIFLTGSLGEINCWDRRMPPNKAFKCYKKNFKQVLDIEFILSDGTQFVCSTDTVSRESAEQNIICWDFRSGAVLSNQIYHEKFTCPCVKRHPFEEVFGAQSNGNYVALFNSNAPFKLNKYKRFEGHKVLGYAVDFDFSVDGRFVYSGSSGGCLFVYDFRNGKCVKNIPVSKSSPLVNLQVHPVLFSTIALGFWDGSIMIWR